jgi:hypothetical protein
VCHDLRQTWGEGPAYSRAGWRRTV